ncbi:MAG: ribonuclease PH [Planctomycetota bacterium]|nr:MAG: ribonuclease PH [Planctomycetota bacterium]
MREFNLELNVNDYAEGSVIIKMGKTHVLCVASIEEKVPRWMANSGKGWVSAEYNMLPRANRQRKPRDISKGKQDGRSIEIQRLIGRSLRAVVDMEALGERMLWIDCDVLQADGGTRCASITGGAVAMAMAFNKLKAQGLITKNPMKEHIAAISVVKKGSDFIVDPDYEQDSSSDVDMNIVMTEGGNFVEIQGTAEGDVFSREDNDQILNLATDSIKQLIQLQKDALNE